MFFSLFTIVSNTIGGNNSKEIRTRCFKSSLSSTGVLHQAYYKRVDRIQVYTDRDCLAAIRTVAFHNTCR